MMNRRELLKTAAAAAVPGLLPIVAPCWAARRAGKLLLVHGRGQQGLNPDTLKTEWLEALERGAATFGQKVPADVDVAFPFYGDLLDKYTQQFGIPLTSDLRARGTALDDEFLVFQAEFAEAVRQRAGITDAQVDAEYGAEPTARGPLNWKWVQAILRAIDKNSNGLNQKSLETFTRDVFLYTTRAGVRDEIDRIVASQLTEEPTVVVGHSLGSVVAYSILRTDRRKLRVPLFVTVGSPLAVRAVRDQFRPLQSPPSVEAWYNAFDRHDVVALYPLDAVNFPVQPVIENNSAVKNHTDNRHGIAGYLDDPQVAKRIQNVLAN
jgi:hypothetical protein